jgi:hypothetical protein
VGSLPNDICGAITNGRASKVKPSGWCSSPRVLANQSLSHSFLIRDLLFRHSGDSLPVDSLCDWSFYFRHFHQSLCGVDWHMIQQLLASFIWLGICSIWFFRQNRFLLSNCHFLAQLLLPFIYSSLFTNLIIFFFIDNAPNQKPFQIFLSLKKLNSMIFQLAFCPNHIKFLSSLLIQQLLRHRCFFHAQPRIALIVKIHDVFLTLCLYFVFEGLWHFCPIKWGWVVKFLTNDWVIDFVVNANLFQLTRLLLLKCLFIVRCLTQ